MSKEKREPRYTDWCFTCNNPPRSPSSVVSVLTSLNAAFCFQLETGDSGTPHYQGVVRFRVKRAFSTVVKKTAAALPGAHWERCKALASAIAYCQKPEGRVAGPWIGRPVSGAVAGPKQEALFRLVQAPTDRYEEARASPWQKDLLQTLSLPPDSRTVHWFYETVGGVGKSCMARHLVGFAWAGRAIIVSGRAADIRHRFISFAGENGAPALVIVDIPRVSKGHFSVAAIEDIKNGIISSSKYEGGQLVFDPPHVVVFSNDPPPWSAMSLDRWNVRHIQQNGSFTHVGPVVDGPEGLEWDVLL